MKKLLILCCLTMIIYSCQKDGTNDDSELTIEETNEALVRKSKGSKINIINNKYNEVAAKRDDTEESLGVMACTVDPDDFEECEVTFKVLCIDDCGRNLMIDGEVWITFEYRTFEPANASNTAYVKNNWGSVAGGGANLQIGQEYTLQHPVIVSDDCPMYIWGEMWSCCYACIPSCPFSELEFVGGTIYLEINGHMYYPIKIWNIPYCSSLSVLDPTPSNIEHVVTTTLDENCYVSGRVDYVQDPCGGDSF